MAADDMRAFYERRWVIVVTDGGGGDFAFAV